jgi:ATP-dependent helicase/nuclease subunit A
MSIHKSKGLEFPIVFVAGLGTRFNQRDLYGTFLYDRKLGFGPQVIDPTTHIKAQTLASLGVRESIRRAGLSEEMRILYVALTRARERLYMVGTVPNLTETVGRWQEQAGSVREQGKLPLYLAASAKRYMDWLGHVLCSQPKLVPNTINFDVVSAEVPGWRVSLYPPAAVVAELSIPTELGETRSKVSQTEMDSSDAVTLPPELRERLNQQIEWKYPWAALGSIAAKTTVTELKRRQKQIADPENPVAPPFRHATFRRPAFIVGESKLTATEVGTATHLVLQHLPLHEAVTPALVTTCIEDLINRNFLTAQEGAAVQSQAIVDFFDTPLGKRMITAASVPDQTLWREVPFSLAIPVDELSAGVPTLPTEELLPGVHTADSSTIDIPDKGRDAVILQGVIDALFQGPTGWVLVDFKTDRLTGEDIESVALTRYAAQVRWYTKAAAQVMGVSITECYLVMLTHNQVVPVDFRSDLMDAM